MAGHAARLRYAVRYASCCGVDDRCSCYDAADQVPQPFGRDRRIQPPPNIADQSFDLVDGQLIQLVEPRLVLAHGTAQRRVGRHPDVVEVGNDLLPAVGQIREEDTMLVSPPTIWSRVPDVGSVQRVRVPVKPEHRLAGEREVGVIKRLAVTEADEGMKHRAECLLGTDVADSSYQVAVRLQQTRQSCVGDCQVGGRSGKRQKGGVS